MTPPAQLHYTNNAEIIYCFKSVVDPPHVVDS